MIASRDRRKAVDRRLLNLADPVLGEQFVAEHAGHVEQLAAWLAEVFGGPPDYTRRFGGFPAMLDHHVGLAITDEQRARFMAVTMEAADAVGLPDAGRAGSPRNGRRSHRGVHRSPRRPLLDARRHRQRLASDPGTSA